MFYIVTKQPPRYHQMTLEELIFGIHCDQPLFISNDTNTRTYVRSAVPDKFKGQINVSRMIEKLREFNQETEPLRQQPRESLYATFYIPKSSGGWRRIDAPYDELMKPLRQLKQLFEDDFRVLYHTSAFAYVKGRSTLKCIQRHQQNESKWFAKLDLHDFFGSTTLDFVMRQFSMVFPFSEICAQEDGRAELKKALELGFLNGGLPQGTPLSPTLTNIMMIPVDFQLSKKLRDFNGNNFIYTRYADDFIISSKYDFKISEVEQLVVDTLRGFDAPFYLNQQKTRYGSSAGANWNLGVMLNKDNEITVGYRKIKQFKSALHNYLRDKQRGITWALNDLQVTQGLYAYYHAVEGKKIDEIVAAFNQKNNTDVIKMIRQDIRGLSAA